MRKSYTGKIIKTALLAILVPAGIALAGNPDRAGQAGATELLINPWARSTGWNGANSGMAQRTGGTILKCGRYSTYSQN